MKINVTAAWTYGLSYVLLPAYSRPQYKIVKGIDGFSFKKPLIDLEVIPF